MNNTPRVLTYSFGIDCRLIGGRERVLLSYSDQYVDGYMAIYRNRRCYYTYTTACAWLTYSLLDVSVVKLLIILAFLEGKSFLIKALVFAYLNLHLRFGVDIVQYKL